MKTFLFLALAAGVPAALLAQASSAPPPPWQPTPEQVNKAYADTAHQTAIQLSDANATILLLQARVAELQSRIAELEKRLADAKEPAAAEKNDHH